MKNKLTTENCQLKTKINGLKEDTLSLVKAAASFTKAAENVEAMITSRSSTVPATVSASGANLPPTLEADKANRRPPVDSNVETISTDPNQQKVRDISSPPLLVYNKHVRRSARYRAFSKSFSVVLMLNKLYFLF